MPAVRKTRLTSAVWRVHPTLYRLTKGKVGGRIGALDVIVLTTQGRRTGEPRSVALMGFDDDDRMVVCGSNAGEPQAPAWVHNLRANPRGVVQRGARVFDVVAQEAEGDERARLWERLVALDPGYVEYQARTSRRLPLMVLCPRTSVEIGSPVAPYRVAGPVLTQRGRHVVG